MQSTGARLRQAIADQWPRLTQIEFAARMGVSRIALANYLAGRTSPPFGFWKAAAVELGIDPSAILDEDRVAA